MPRKQRFKPSRKPKPSPQTEEAMIGHQVSSGLPSNDEHVEAREAPPRDDGSDVEFESEQRSR